MRKCHLPLAGLELHAPATYFPAMGKGTRRSQAIGHGEALELSLLTFDQMGEWKREPH